MTNKIPTPTESESSSNRFQPKPQKEDVPTSVLTALFMLCVAFIFCLLWLTSDKLIDSLIAYWSR